jgi:DNA-directed RNA polymerase subunit RPC12/RpoP
MGRLIVQTNGEYVLYYCPLCGYRFEEPIRLLKERGKAGKLIEAKLRKVN